jgi:hypothetical protein
MCHLGLTAGWRRRRGPEQPEASSASARGRTSTTSRPGRYAAFTGQAMSVRLVQDMRHRVVARVDDTDLHRRGGAGCATGEASPELDQKGGGSSRHMHRQALAPRPEARTCIRPAVSCLSERGGSLELAARRRGVLTGRPAVLLASFRLESRACRRLAPRSFRAIGLLCRFGTTAPATDRPVCRATKS